MKKRLWSPLLLPTLLFPVSLIAGDWPQYLGVERNGTARNETLLTQWPDEGPKKIWQQPVGEGFAGPVTHGDTMVIFHRVGDIERIEARATDDGSLRWQADFPGSYRGGINPDSGPRSTPTIAGGKVFALGAGGDVYAVHLKDGSTSWTRAAAKEFRAPEGYFGFACSPLVVDGKVIINLGGKDAGIVALNTETGKTEWKATDFAASYSSPVLYQQADGAQVIVCARLDTVALDPDTGVVAWSISFGARGPTVNGAAPLIIDEHLFLTSSYRVGAQLLNITGKAPKEIWANDQSLSSQYASSIHHNGYIYGTHGREDIPPAHLRCVDAKTGDIRWSADGHGVTHLIRSEALLLALTIEGELSLLKAQPDTFERLEKAQVTKDGTRALPALANGTLFFRTTNDGQGGTLMAIEVGKR